MIGEPRDEIIAAAANLFSERGVASTTMSEIAGRAGLRQSSIYYYFKDKEAILAEILSGVNRLPLESFDEIQAEGGSAAERLHRIIEADVMILCSFPFDLNQVHRLAELRDERFATYWEERAALHRRLRGLLREGIEGGEFIPIDAGLAAHTLLSNDEASQNWLRAHHDGGGSAADLAEPGEVAAFIADFALRSLLVDPGMLGRLRRSTDPAA